MSLRRAEPTSLRRRSTPALSLLLLILAGCAATGPAATPGSDAGFLSPGLSVPPVTGSASPSPSRAATSSGSPAAPTPSAAASAPPGPSDPPSAPALTGPPRALLDGFRAGRVAGDLGTYVWDETGSDAPWVIGLARGIAAPGAHLSVVLRPELPVVAWRARWARVTGGQAGTPRSGGSGTSDGIEMTAPSSAGSWSLQLNVELGPDRSANWYWRVEVTR